MCSGSATAARSRAATYADLPQPYREADLAVSGDPAHAERMFHLDRELMLTGFTDWPDALVASITAPALVVAAPTSSTTALSSTFNHRVDRQPICVVRSFQPSS
jgi:hypothetical protein